VRNFWPSNISHKRLQGMHDAVLKREKEREREKAAAAKAASGDT